MYRCEQNKYAAVNLLAARSALFFLFSLSFSLLRRHRYQRCSLYPVQQANHHLDIPIIAIIATIATIATTTSHHHNHLHPTLVMSGVTTSAGIIAVSISIDIVCVCDVVLLLL